MRKNSLVVDHFLLKEVGGGYRWHVFYVGLFGGAQRGGTGDRNILKCQIKDEV